MDIIKVLIKHYDGIGWSCGDTYETLRWDKEYGEKPTEEHLTSLWDGMKTDIMREERNTLLQETDFRALPDFPNRDLWLEYRQQLRDFPEVWVDGMDFPEKPV